MTIENFLRTEKQKQYPKVGFILSTSGSRDSHEWDRFQGGVFTHELVSGLLGAADLNLDGLIEYSEIAAFIEAANAHLEQAAVELEVTVRPPSINLNAVLMDINGYPSHRLLHLSVDVEGRFFLEDSKGVQFCDFNKSGAIPINLLLIGKSPFYIKSATREARVAPEGRKWVRFESLAFLPRRTNRRGAVENAFQEKLFKEPFDWSFYRGFIASSKMVPVVTEPAIRLEPPPPAASALKRWRIGYQLMSAPYGLSGAMHGIGASHHYPFSSWLSAKAGTAYRFSQGTAEGEEYYLHMAELSIGLEASFARFVYVPAIYLGAGLATLIKTGEAGKGQDQFVPFIEASVGAYRRRVLGNVDLGIHVGLRALISETEERRFNTSHFVFYVDLIL